MKVAILGNGFVGNATNHFLTTFCKDVEVLIEDPAQGKHIDDWSDVEYTFICVPTNIEDVNRKLSLSNVLVALKRAKGTCIIRSTIGPDQVGILALSTTKPIILWPEFLREKSWKEDVENPEFPILLGGDANKFHNDVLPHDFRHVVRTTNVEAAMIKVSRNAMLAAKVAQSNMIYDMCTKWDAQYKVVRNFLKTEGTLGKTHFDVPGHDNKRGFGGKCLPKDTTHWESMFDEDNMYTMLLEYNETL